VSGFETNYFLSAKRNNLQISFLLYITLVPFTNYRTESIARKRKKQRRKKKKKKSFECQNILKTISHKKSRKN